MMFQEPALLHQMLSILADNIGEYANFQVSASRCWCDNIGWCWG